MTDWADRDEGRHQPDRDGPGWSETFAYELATIDGFGVAVHVTVHPFERRAWYWCVVARPDAPVVAIVDLDVPLPGRPASLELRTDGLWADHNVETPWRHVSVGLEAFGLALDDPRALLGDGRGDRVPVGLDLEWESEPGAVVDRRLDETDGYEVLGRAHGELLLGPDAHQLEGSGWREHRWGAIDWWDPPSSSRHWVGAGGPPPRGAVRFRPSGSGALPGSLGPALLGGSAARSSVVFRLPSFGDRSATMALGMFRHDEPDHGAGWQLVRTTEREGGSRS